MVCLLRADDVHFDLVFKLFSSSEILAAIPSSNEHQKSIDSSSIYSFYLSAIAINEKATCRIGGFLQFKLETRIVTHLILNRLNSNNVARTV